MVNWVTSLGTKALLYIVMALTAISLCIDLIGLDGGYWFLGSTAATAYFLVPGVILHLNLPKTLRNNWLAIPMCILWWCIWIVVRSVMTDVGDFRPTILSMINLLLLYRLIKSEQSVHTGKVLDAFRSKVSRLRTKKIANKLDKTQSSMEAAAMNLWLGRLFRFWIVFLLPLASWSTYMAFESHESSVMYQEAVSSSYDQMRRYNEYHTGQSTYKPLWSKEEIQERFDMSAELRNRNQANRTLYAVAAMGLILLPVIIWVLSLVLRWIWHGKLKDRHPSDGEPDIVS